MVSTGIREISLQPTLRHKLSFVMVLSVSHHEFIRTLANGGSLLHHMDRKRLGLTLDSIQYAKGSLLKGATALRHLRVYIRRCVTQNKADGGPRKGADEHCNQPFTD